MALTHQQLSTVHSVRKLYSLIAQKVEQYGSEPSLQSVDSCSGLSRLSSFRGEWQVPSALSTPTIETPVSSVNSSAQSSPMNNENEDDDNDWAPPSVQSVNLHLLQQDPQWRL